MTSTRARPPVWWQRVDSTTELEAFYGLQDLDSRAPPPLTFGIGRRRGQVRRLAHKLVRYTAVSAISTTVSLSILGFLVATRPLSAGWANILATSVATIPSFELNRRWVWKKVGQRSLLAEVGPFCALSFT